MLGTALASGKRELRAISFKESVASGGNRPINQYFKCKGENTVITGRDLQWGKGFLVVREEEPKMQRGI